ncbi:MAG: transcription termination/antitermination protein NusA [Candidatus Omnitrophica bacterium]|nr:transcription termination/antitermination protein NusA [Candidatus Omnitrophota bacterium]
MNKKELLITLEYIEREKGVKHEVLIEALESALVSACRRIFPNDAEIDVKIEPQTAEIKVFCDQKEVSLPQFGRIAAQVAKQVIIQKIREAEKENIYEEFKQKEKTIVNGEVYRFEGKNVVINLGKVKALLPFREQSPLDRYRQGERIRAYLLEVSKKGSMPQVILSRNHPQFVSQLFKLEVPEIYQGIVEIKEVARQVGERVKIAVFSTDDKIDPVGACVGIRGQRVKDVIQELRQEKVDIIRWDADPQVFIANALSPAEIVSVKLNKEEKRAKVMVKDESLSLAIGKHGQNIRLASKLTDWIIDVRGIGAEEEEISLISIKGIGEKTKEVLIAAGYSAKSLAVASVEELIKIPSIGKKTAEKIQAASRKPQATSYRSRNKKLVV